MYNSKVRWCLLLLLCLLLPPWNSNAQSSSRYLECTLIVAINQTTGTTIITGTASQRIYICSILLVSATAQNVSIVEGTGTVCATGITALYGGTTASIALAANGGFAQASPKPFISTQVTANGLCILQSGAGNVSGSISYVKIVP